MNLDQALTQYLQEKRVFFQCRGLNLYLCIFMFSPETINDLAIYSFLQNKEHKIRFCFESCASAFLFTVDEQMIKSLKKDFKKNKNNNEPV